MTSVGAVLVRGPFGHTFRARAAELGIELHRKIHPEEPLWIDASARLSFAEDTLALAKRVSSVVGTDVATFALVAQTSADSYLFAELRGGELVRQISYDRDGEGWRAEGASRPWETELCFALPKADFVEHLEDVDWSDEDIAQAVRAYEARDVEKLPRLPDASRRQFFAFAEKLGIDFRAGPPATYRKPSLFRRLFG